MKGQATLFSSASGEHSTPQDLFDRLDACYGFTVDAAATKENAKLPRYWTKEDSGLDHSWDGERIWCNPPYGRGVVNWVSKAYHQGAGLSVLLLPVRTDTGWFQNYILNNRKVHVDFLRGRLKFGGATNSAPFPSMIVTFMNW